MDADIHFFDFHPSGLVPTRMLFLPSSSPPHAISAQAYAWVMLVCMKFEALFDMIMFYHVGACVAQMQVLWLNKLHLPNPSDPTGGD